MPSYPASAPPAGPKSRTCDSQPWYRGGARLVFDGVDPSMLQGVWAPFYAVPGYAGPLLRARRASDDAEIDVFNWSSLNAFLTGTAGFVTALYDQSGNGHDAVQAADASQPAINLMSNGIIEIDPDNSNDYLRATLTVDTSAQFEMWGVGWDNGSYNWANSTFMSLSESDAENDGFTWSFGASGGLPRANIWKNGGTEQGTLANGHIRPGIAVLSGGRRSNAWKFLSNYGFGRATQALNFNTEGPFQRVDLCAMRSLATTRHADNPCYFFAVCQPGTQGTGAEYELIASRLWAKLGNAR